MTNDDHLTMTEYDPDELKDRVESLLNDVHGDRVFAVEDGVVWVSGMNARCPTVARRMAKTLVKDGIPCGLVYEDDAVRFGGVQFNFGPRNGGEETNTDHA
jgi:hypothetical protein